MEVIWRHLEHVIVRVSVTTRSTCGVKLGLVTIPSRYRGIESYRIAVKYLGRRSCIKRVQRNRNIFGGSKLLQERVVQESLVVRVPANTGLLGQIGHWVWPV